MRFNFIAAACLVLAVCLCLKVQVAEAKPITTPEGKLPLVHWAVLQAKPGTMGEMMGMAARNVAPLAAKESGTYALYGSLDKQNPNIMRLLEIYEDEAAYEVHVGSDGFRKYREERKAILEKASGEACLSLFGKELPDGVLHSCCFNESLWAFGLDEVLDARDIMETNEYALMAERPWFTVNLESLRKRFAGREKVGVEGGPCLFGTDELHFSFTMKDGSTRQFDYNTRQEILPDREFLQGTSMELFDFMEEECGNVAAASLDCPKRSITVDEYEMLKYILLVAKYLDARAVVTIPDFSYDKTFVSMFSGLEPGVYEGFHEAFRRECLRMSDLMIDTTKKLALQYGVDDYVILHSRDEELLNIFYEKREPFCADKYANRFLTSRNGLRDALLDYICMPAFPYYLFGIREIVEVNRIDEFYSLHKCKKIHHSAINLNMLLFPEKTCRNGKTSGFFAKMEDKEFVEFV